MSARGQRQRSSSGQGASASPQQPDGPTTASIFCSMPGADQLDGRRSSASRAPRRSVSAYPPPHRLELSTRFRGSGSAPERWPTCGPRFSKKASTRALASSSLTVIEPLARELFPLAERLEPEPWMGRRPCLPEMVPVIGKGERHPNGERERLQICMSAGNAVSEPAGGVTRWLREGLLPGHHLGGQATGDGT